MIESVLHQEVEILRLIDDCFEEKEEAVKRLESTFTEDVLVKYCAERRLLGGLYPSLRSQKGSYKGLMVRSKKTFIAQQASHLQQCARIKEVLSVLDQFDGSLMLLKGPPFAQRFYRDAGKRRSWDIDLLLLGTENYQSCSTVLLQNGFRKIGYSMPPSLIRAATHAQFYSKGRINVDLHITLRSIWGVQFNIQEIFTGAEMFEGSGFSCLVPNQEDSLFFQLMIIVADMTGEQISYRSYFDTLAVLRTSNRSICWDEFFQIRKRDGTFRHVINALQLIITVFDLQEEFPALQRVLESSRHLIVSKSAYQYVRLGQGSRFSFKGKDWVFRASERSYWSNWLRWLALFPVRALVYGVSVAPRFRTKLERK